MHCFANTHSVNEVSWSRAVHTRRFFDELLGTSWQSTSVGKESSKRGMNDTPTVCGGKLRCTSLQLIGEPLIYPLKEEES